MGSTLPAGALHRSAVVTVSRPRRHAPVTALVSLSRALAAAGVIAGLVGAGAPPIAGAQELAGGAPRAGEPSWADYLAPERRVARQLRRDGLARLLDAMLSSGESLGRPPDVLYDQALIRFDRARRALRRDPDLLYFRAIALASWRRDVGGHEERRTEEAIEAYEELRRVDPDYHADRVAFELAILHSRSGEHEAAVAEYRRAIDAATIDPAPTPYPIADRERALALLFRPIELSTAHLNLAENTMMLGDLPSAVASYRRASELASDDPVTRALALWGLALALCRDGDQRQAIATAQRAIEGDPFPLDVSRWRVDHRAHGPMAVLHSTLVFFEPAYEVLAYDALGWEAMARQASAPADREELLGRALRAWRTYLSHGGNASLHAAHARAAEARLAAEIQGAETGGAETGTRSGTRAGTRSRR